MKKFYLGAYIPNAVQSPVKQKMSAILDYVVKREIIESY